MKSASICIGTLILATYGLTGCATHYQEAAVREQRAADVLRSGGATEAAQAAQKRADKNRDAAQCKEFVECALDIVGQAVLGLLGGGTAGKR